MYLKEGQYGKRRDGVKVGPMLPREATRKNTDIFPWFYRCGEGKRHIYTHKGHYHADGSESPFDIVEDWVDEKPPIAIDQVSLAHFRRGVEKVMPSLSIVRER